MILDLWRKYWERFDWVEELFYLNVLATEACLIYPWQLLFHTLTGYKGISFLGLCVLLWVLYLVASLLNLIELPLDRKQAAIGGLIFVSMLFITRLHIYSETPILDTSWIPALADRLFNALSDMPPDLITVILVFVVWWRSIAASRKEYDTTSVRRLFQVGILILTGYFLSTIWGQHSDLTLVIFAYFFFGLMSIALARLIESGSIHKSALGSRQWVGVLIGSTLGNLGLALLASLIVSRRTLRAVISWFRPLIAFVEKVIWYIVMFVFYLAWPLIEWLLALLMSRLKGRGFAVSPIGSPLGSPLEETAELNNPGLTRVCNTVFILLIMVGGLFLLARLIRRLTLRQKERQDLERESLFSGQAFLNDLKDSLLEGLNQLRALAGQLGGRRRRSVATIRKLYASMVDLATEVGHPRRRSETPYEYRRKLYKAFPEGEKEVDAITQAYVRVHYGEVPDSQEELDQLTAYWETLQASVLPEETEET